MLAKIALGIIVTVGLSSIGWRYFGRDWYMRFRLWRIDKQSIKMLRKGQK